MKDSRISVGQIWGDDIPNRIRANGYDSLFCVYVGLKLEAVFVSLEELNKFLPYIENEIVGSFNGTTGHPPIATPLISQIKIINHPSALATYINQEGIV